MATVESIEKHKNSNNWNFNKKAQSRNGKSAWRDKLRLKERVRDLLDRQGVEALRDFEVRGDSGVNYRFDFFVPGAQRYSQDKSTLGSKAEYSLSRGMGIFVKDYSGPAKVTNIIQAERAMKDCPEISKVLVISNSFSGPSANLADRTGVILLSLGEIVSTYKNEGWKI
ncbi:MAG: hypothetical protein ACFFB3_05065 [Candidatus Hodarchaeota archaeon]